MSAESQTLGIGNRVYLIAARPTVLLPLLNESSVPILSANATIVEWLASDGDWVYHSEQQRSAKHRSLQPLILTQLGIQQ